jgi:hypothetical protein
MKKILLVIAILASQNIFSQEIVITPEKNKNLH